MVAPVPLRHTPLVGKGVRSFTSTPPAKGDKVWSPEVLKTLECLSVASFLKLFWYSVFLRFRIEL